MKSSLYEKIISLSPSGICVYDETGQCIVVNDSIGPIIGTTSDQVLKQNYNDLESWKKSGLLEKAKKAVKETRPQRHKLQVKSTFGQEVGLECHLIPFKWEENQRLLLIVNDISKQIQYEKALEKEKECFQMYLDIAAVMFVVINRDKNVVLINKKGCEVLGYPEPEIVGKNWFENFLPAGIQEETESVFKKLLAGRTDLEAYHENPVLTAAGEEKLIAWHNTVLKDENGKIEGMLSCGEDITLKREKTVALRLSEKRYRALVEDMPALICRFRAGGIITFVNSSYGRYFNKHCKDLVGKDFFQFIPEKEREKVRQHYESLTVENPLVKYEHKVISPDGKIRWQEWTDRAIFDNDGRLVEYQAIGYDITERKNTEKELEKKMHDLEVFRAAAVDRELKMVELKKEIKKLKTELEALSGGQGSGDNKTES